ncbi:MAG: hypothetical protein RI556_00190 [Hydrogenovibrio sp.]|uniref:hypothetical protein n=1 Tax=Hydrogenovibrio sp. TaxID=2065821 RepID=UPI00286FF137|nr:hypothetical protein [Hydrogenovibrio sp.]MDR9497572.1 hypothetical protein [Hydrogenovibrio sp.]
MFHKRNRQDAQKGASLLEYALVIAAVVGIAAVIFGGDAGLDTAIKDKVSDSVEEINDTDTSTQ